MRVWILPRWSSVPLSAITHADIVTWVGEIQRHRSPALTRHTIGVLSQMLELAVRDGRLARNPARGVPRPRLTKPVQRFLTYGELSTLVEHTRPPYDLLVLVLAITGLRFGEAAGLTVADVDTERGRLTVNWSITETANGKVHRDLPKTGQRRSVPLPNFLAQRLVDFVADRPLDEQLFQSPKGGVLRNSNFRRVVFDPAVRAADLQPFTPHNLRDTAASLAVASGANVKTIQRMLGHASAAMTLDVYSGLFDADLDDLAQRIENAASRYFSA
jgi:integrase